MISSNTQFERDDLSMMSSVLGNRRESVNDRKMVAKKRTELNIEEGRIEEIEKELEELDSPSPKHKKDVLEEAHELVDDDDMISQYSSKISVLNDPGVKMIDKEL